MKEQTISTTTFILQQWIINAFHQMDAPKWHKGFFVWNRVSINSINKKVNKFDRFSHRWMILIFWFSQPQNIIQVSISYTFQSRPSSLSLTQFEPAVNRYFFKIFSQFWLQALAQVVQGTNVSSRMNLSLDHSFISKPAERLCMPAVPASTTEPLDRLGCFHTQHKRPCQGYREFL